MKSLSKTCAYFMRQDECKYNSKITFVIVHYSDIIWASRCPQITGHSSVCSTVCSGWHQSSTWLARCAGNRPVTGGKPFVRVFVRQFVLDDTNENLKVPHYIPHTKSQTWAWRSHDISRLGHEAINTLRPRQNGRRFADDTFKRIFLIENVRISIEISLKFVPKGPINNIPALVQIMVWRRSGDKPLSEPMMVGFLTHICVTRPQWVK